MTKQTLYKVHGRIVDGTATTRHILINTDDIEEEVNHLRENQHPERLDVGVVETIVPRDLRQDVLSRYSLSSAVIKAFAEELVKRELVVEEQSSLSTSKEPESTVSRDGEQIWRGTPTFPKYLVLHCESDFQVNGQTQTQ